MRHAKRPDHYLCDTVEQQFADLSSLGVKWSQVQILSARPGQRHFRRSVRCLFHLYDNRYENQDSVRQRSQPESPRPSTAARAVSSEVVTTSSSISTWLGVISAASAQADVGRSHAILHTEVSRHHLRWVPQVEVVADTPGPPAQGIRRLMSRRAPAPAAAFDESSRDSVGPSSPWPTRNVILPGSVVWSTWIVNAATRSTGVVNGSISKLRPRDGAAI
jgi:hypothetical protein